jgi:hypothetical protein
MTVDVRVNFAAPTLAYLHAGGKPLPTSRAGKGLIDTGTDISAVSSSVLQQLGVPVHGQTQTHAIGGPTLVRLFKVSLLILDAGQPHVPWFTQANLLVMELPAVLPVDVLIGMDVLLTCKLLLDGPVRQFTLEF